MNIVDEDYFLINNLSDISHKVKASKLKTLIDKGAYGNYRLLVNYDDDRSFFVFLKNLKNKLRPKNLMIIERDGATFSVTGAQVLDYLV